MPDLKRVRIDEIPRQDRWNLQVVWKEERDRIEGFVREQADLAYGKHQDPVRAKRLSTEVWSTVSQIFPSEKEIDVANLSKARSGKLRDEAGSYGGLKALGLLKWLAFGSEIAVFAAMWLWGESSPLIVVRGAILAISAYILGWGLGGLFMWVGRSGDERTLPMLMPSLAIVIGATGISLIIALTARLQEEGDTFAVIALTLALALVVALLEALHRALGHNYDRKWHDMFRAQVEFANEQHRGLHQTAGKLWIDQFNSIVDFNTASTWPETKDSHERSRKEPPEQSLKESQEEPRSATSTEPDTK